MIRVVIDTNILVSAVMSRQGPSAQVFGLILAGLILPCITDAVLREYRGVFIGSPRLQRLDPQRIAALIRLLELASLKVTPTATLNISDHEPDNRFYECADAAKADYIVTGNTKHFKEPYKTTKIVTARQLLDIVAPVKK